MITHPCGECPLRKLSAFRSSSDEEISFIQQFKKGAIKVSAGGTVIPEGKASDDLYTLYSGWAFRFKSLSDGRRQILNFLLPGDFIGLHEAMADVSVHGVETLTDATLCVFPGGRLWDLYRNHPSLGYDITWLSAHEESILDENLLSVGQRSAQERIAMLIVHLYKRAKSLELGHGNRVPFPITQQHIADALGLSLVHTNKTLRKLVRLGLYEIADGQLEVLNPGALQRMADYYASPLKGRPLV